MFEAATRHRTLLWSIWRGVDQEKASFEHVDAVLALQGSRALDDFFHPETAEPATRTKWKMLVAIKPEMRGFSDT